jgi:molybdenum cofactor cytidylyltransferase
VVSAILLAAGESKRMGLNKLSLPWGRKTVFEHCLDTLLRSRVEEVIIVLGGRSEERRKEIEGRRASSDKKVKVVRNSQYKKGMSTSIRRGIESMDPATHGILIALGDQPEVKARTINALIHAFAQGRGSIVIPSCRGRRGHPVLFDRSYERDLLRLKGDVGGRSVIERHLSEVTEVRTRSEAVIRDVDTQEEYEKLKAKGRKRKAETYL